LCTPVVNCFYTPGTACGNATVPNCKCLPGYELLDARCQPCKDGFFQSSNSSLPCLPWSKPLSCTTGFLPTNGTRSKDAACVQCQPPPGNSTIKNSGCQWQCNAGFNNTVFR
jgi:hypothetical protein